MASFRFTTRRRTQVVPSGMALVAAGMTIAMTLQVGAQPAPPSTPVLVELFTSEGCSDCPPADRLLERLDQSQPVEGVHAIVLSEHVTYWDRLGWRDPFSMQEMTERQQGYAARFRLQDVYTPQMVVDGTKQFVGSDARALVAALRAASGRPKEDLTISYAGWKDGKVEFAVRGIAGSDEKLVTVLAADAAESQVARGENAGHVLHHVAVVRIWKEFGSEAMDGRMLRFDDGGSPGGRLRLVVFAVGRKTGQVVGAAEQTLETESKNDGHAAKG